MGARSSKSKLIKAEALKVIVNEAIKQNNQDLVTKIDEIIDKSIEKTVTEDEILLLNSLLKTPITIFKYKFK